MSPADETIQGCACCLAMGDVPQAAVALCAECSEPACAFCLDGGTTCCRCDVTLEELARYGERTKQA